MNTVDLTLKDLEEIISETFNLLTENSLQVKVVSPKEKYVTFVDDSASNLLNTTLQDSPTVDEVMFGNIKLATYSMFKRIGNKRGDGNPALYALKGENNWSMTNTEEFWNRFDEIIDKFLETHSKFDTIIQLPSTNPLNTKILTHLSKKIPSVNVIDKLLHKLTTDEVMSKCDTEGSYFAKYWQGRYQEGFDKLNGYLEKMDEKNNGIFSYHMIDDQELRKTVINTMKVLPEDAFLYVPQINGKDIILLDDSITHGQSIKSACSALLSCYTPKSISVFTMFSKLYN